MSAARAFALLMAFSSRKSEMRVMHQNVAYICLFRARFIHFSLRGHYNFGCDDYDAGSEDPIMNASLELILARLRGVRHRNTGWSALCPAHPDRNPSLSVREQNGRVLLHCFAGCSVQAICAALGLELGDLFAAPRQTGKPEPDVVRRTRKQIKSLHGRLTPRDRQRDVTVVLANKDNPDPAMARALALAVEGELVQIAFKEEV